MAGLPSGHALIVTVAHRIAVSLRLHMIVVEECVYDRHESSLAMSLFDMDQKYGDVLGIDEVLGWIEAHPGGENED